MPASRFAQLFVFRTCFAHVFWPQLLGGFWSVHCSQETRGGGDGGDGDAGGGEAHLKNLACTDRMICELPAVVVA